MIPLLIMDSENVTVERLAVDYERPYYSEGSVTSVDDQFTEVEIDKKTYPYEIKNNKFVFIGEGWREGHGPAAWLLRRERGISSPIRRTSVGTAMWSPWEETASS